MSAAYGFLIGAKPAEALVIPAPTPAFTLGVPLPDGTTRRFGFIVRGHGDRVGVEELRPHQLPTACPQRHINSDGSFCLGYRETDPSVVLDQSDAERWWAVIIKFLIQQAQADESGRWRGAEWGHGSVATHQVVAEKALADLYRGRRSDVSVGDVTARLRRRTGGAEFLRVLVKGRHWFSVKREHSSIVTVRRPCLCGSGRPAKSCPTHRSGHAILAAELAEAIYALDAAESDFWKDWNGRPCCGTMRDCPLRDRKPDLFTISPLAA